MTDCTEMDTTQSRPALAASPWAAELRELMKLAWPLVITQLA
jgi:hypothetical protein